jgi:UDP-N-acetylmuramate dehydrogenase
MDCEYLYQQLKKKFPKYEIFKDFVLAPYTTVKIGGPADIFINTKTNHQFKRVLRTLAEFKAENITILGNGSNVLISDSGIRGVVVKNSSKKIKILNDSNKHQKLGVINSHRTENDPTKYLNFDKLDYDESDCSTVNVEFSSGVFLPYALNYLFDHGVTGLQWFAYIPGTIGGAVWYNIHGGKYHFSDFMESITVFDIQAGCLKKYLKSELNWDYDQSFFQLHPELVIVSVVLRLFRGDTERAKYTAQSWIEQKTKVQPINSLGSVFKNPSLKDCLKVWGEQKTAGWIIDHELNWKGKSVGNAQISEKHANFIVNNGHASATEYYTLTKSVQDEVQKRFGIKLEIEAKLLGNFNQSRLSK